MNIVEHWDLAVQELSETDKTLKKVISLYPHEKITLKNDGFLTLIRSVVGQQISVKAADSVWKKLEELCKKSMKPKTILSFSLEELRNVGLSKSKANYIQNIANSNILDTNWEETSDTEATKLLCTIKGIGKWTAEMFLIFHLARPNILPLGDIGLIRAMENQYNKGKKISNNTIEKLRERWDPWCSVVTWYLWRSLDPVPVNY